MVYPGRQILDPSIAAPEVPPIVDFNGSGTIYANDDLWWFNGVTPSDYSTQITLTSPYSGPATWVWTITQGTNIVTFPGGASSYTAVNNNSATLVSIAASAPAPTLTFDVTVQVAVNGVVRGIGNLAVARPKSLLHISDVDQADPTYGYASYIHYSILDQFGRQLPKTVEVNENWTTDVVSDFQGTNWIRPHPNGLPVDPANLYDRISGSAPQNPNPVAQNPQNPLGNVAVQHWGQAIYVGSITPGQGILVQTDTLQRYQDHGRHLNAQSPI